MPIRWTLRKLRERGERRREHKLSQFKPERYHDMEFETESGAVYSFDRQGRFHGGKLGIRARALYVVGVDRRGYNLMRMHKDTPRAQTPAVIRDVIEPYLVERGRVPKRKRRLVVIFEQGPKSRAFIYAGSPLVYVGPRREQPKE